MTNKITYFQVVGHTSECELITDENKDDADHFELFMGKADDAVRLMSFHRISDIARLIVGLSVAMDTHPGVGSNCEFLLDRIKREMSRFADIESDRVLDPNMKAH